VAGVQLRHNQRWTSPRGVAWNFVVMYGRADSGLTTENGAWCESEERYSSLVAASQDGIFRIDGEGIIRFASQRAADLHGYQDPAELVGQPKAILVTPEYVTQILGSVAEAMQTRQISIIEYLAQRQDGSTFRAEATTAAIDLTIQPYALTVIVRDISEREAAEARLAAERAELKADLEEQVAARTAEIFNLQKVTAALSQAATLLEVADVVVAQVIPLMGASGGSIHVLADDGLHLDYIDGSGYAPDVLASLQRIPLSVARPLTEAIRERSALWIESLDEWRTRYPDDPVAHSEGGHAAAVIPLVTLDGSVGVVSITFLSARRFDDDERRFLLSVCQQCTQALERARLYDSELRRAVELRSVNHELESFAYSVSHDLRSPLRGIDGFSKLVVERYSDRLDDAGKGYLARIQAATVRMSSLIDDLLKLSRVTRTELHLQSVDVSDMAHDVLIDLVTAEPGRNITSVIEPGMVAQADSQLLRVVLENLLGNAWKFTGKSEAARIEVGSFELSSEAVYFVRDDGVGFDMQYADKLFGPFQRLHSMHEFPGTGIGLATVQRIVNRHGGRAWAEGAVQQGATVYFTLGVT
jgi:PAS domain S-box-containing protein